MALKSIKKTYTKDAIHKINEHNYKIMSLYTGNWIMEGQKNEASFSSLDKKIGILVLPFTCWKINFNNVTSEIQFALDRVFLTEICGANSIKKKR